MKGLALSFIAAISFLSTEVATAQNIVRTVQNKNISATKTKAEISIEEINKRLNAVDDVVEKSSSKRDISSGMSYFMEQLLNVAGDYKGTRYLWGGMSRSGMDCSGFVKTAFSQFDVDLPRTSREMAHVGKVIKKEEAKAGDLIFFKNGGSRVINHVGIVIESTNDGEVKFIHSSSSKGVTVSSTREAYYSKSYSQINRVLDNTL